MKFALHTVSFSGFWGQHRLSLEQCIDEAADLGFGGLCVMAKRPHLSVLDYSVEDCRRLRNNAKSRKIEIAALAAYTNFTGGADTPDIPFMEMQVGTIDALCQRAAALGCDLVRIFGSYDRADRPFAWQWDQTVRGIRECCQRAARHGVRIGLQNHHDIAVASKSYRELMLQVDQPNLVAMYDCWSPFLRGENLADEVAKTAAKMAFTIVADYVVLPRSRYTPDVTNYTPAEPPFCMAVPVGEGDLDYKTFFAALKKAGYDGWACFEMCSPLRGGGESVNLRTYAKAFLKFMAEVC